ncbi:hypothetical protein F5Y11DRAFT_340887 [Daldinia sp. FL1419]|nr:hypothetical protein F5Y11DRAFT_340887 [Daldinia sp. FL1419]
MVLRVGSPRNPDGESDPRCDLYVAKATDDEFGITPIRVAKAIEWAISKNVDILPTSVAILDTNSRLESAISAKLGR